jgi:hypothetical protein
VPLYLNRGCIVLWVEEKDWKAVFEVFIFILFLSHHSSSTANALFSMCFVFPSASLLSTSVQKTRSSSYNKHLKPEVEFNSPVRSFIYRLNSVQLVTAPCGSPICKVWYLEQYSPQRTLHALWQMNDSIQWNIKVSLLVTKQTHWWLRVLGSNLRERHFVIKLTQQ